MYGNGFQPKKTLEEMYAEIQRLKGTGTAPSPTTPYRTVFSDISDEWTSCSEEERLYVDADEGYVQASLQYQQQFNSFLLENFGSQFLSSPYGKSAEEVLHALRKARTSFKNNAAATMNTIQNENQTLKKELDELKRLIGGKVDDR